MKCYRVGVLHTTYCYDLIKRSWSKVNIGHSYPCQRYGHSAAIVTGWKPTYHHPKSPRDLDDKESIIPFNTRQKSSENIEYKSCLVVFGGQNEMGVLNDVWVLDLEWKPVDINQFDNNVDAKINQTLKTLYGLSARPSTAPLTPFKMIDDNDSYKIGEVYEKPVNNGVSLLKQSKNITSILVGNNFVSNNGLNKLNSPLLEIETRNKLNNLTNTNIVEINPEIENEIEETMLKVRRERASTDLLLKQERNKLIDAQERIKVLEAKLVELTLSYEELESKYDSDTSTLRNELENSVKQQQLLKLLNQEAYELLVLQGIDNLK